MDKVDVGSDVVELDDAEWMLMVDSTAQRNLGISGAAFIKKYQANEFGEFDDDTDVMRVAALVPFKNRARP